MFIDPVASTTSWQARHNVHALSIDSLIPQFFLLFLMFNAFIGIVGQNIFFSVLFGHSFFIQILSITFIFLS